MNIKDGQPPMGLDDVSVCSGRLWNSLPSVPLLFETQPCEALTWLTPSSAPTMIGSGEGMQAEPRSSFCRIFGLRMKEVN